MSIRQKKSRLRDKLKAKRDRLTPQARRLADGRILDRLMAIEWMKESEVFFVYVSIQPEVSTRALIDSLQNRNRTVLVPKLTRAEGMKAVRFPGWSEMQVGALGIPSPPQTAAYDRQIEVAVVPGIGFTVRGDRLGYGAGHYDRWLQEHRPRHKIAVAFEVQIVDCLATDTHDVAVDFIATEERLIDAGNGTNVL